jgi:hypothetical protein
MFCFAVALVDKCAVVAIPCLEVFAHYTLLTGVGHSAGTCPKVEPFPKTSAAFHRSIPFVSSSVMSNDVDCRRRSASSLIKLSSQVGRVSEILVLGSPSIVFLPAPSRAPPLPIPPISFYLLVFTNIINYFDLGDIFKIK